MTIAINALAAVIGAVSWLVHKNPKVFWWTLRTGQTLVMLEAVIGATLLLTGHDLPRLHLIYGLTPIVVSFLAEQLRIVTTPTFLDRRGLGGGDDVSKLPRSRAARTGRKRSSSASWPSWPRRRLSSPRSVRERPCFFRCALTLSNSGRTRCYKSGT